MHTVSTSRDGSGKSLNSAIQAAMAVHFEGGGEVDFPASATTP